MRMLTKLVWSEGMYLGPQHFQSQNRYFEDALDFVVASLWRDACGFAGLQVDEDALHNGTLSLAYARGLLPDGMAFDFPGSDVIPEPRAFASLFSPVADHLEMHLAIPSLTRDGQNTALVPANGATRYRSIEQLLPDQNTGLDERPVQVAQKNLAFLSDGELSDRHSSLPVVRILRDGTGRFELDRTFIPPCLTLRASSALISLLHRLVDILDEKSLVFSQEQQQRHGVFQAGMSARHVAQYWLLHAINANLPALRGFLLSQQVHPQELFREMSRLAGALCTFGLEVHPRELPAYNHWDLSTCFAALDDHIRRHLEIVLPSKAIRIPLQQMESCLFSGAVTDERCIGPSRWILEIQSPIGEADLIANVPKLTKICSARFVMELIKRSLPGFTLNHISTPPAQIAARVESLYFSIDRVGPCWDHIVQTRQVGVYIPAEIPAPEISLIVLLDE